MTIDAGDKTAGPGAAQAAAHDRPVPISWRRRLYLARQSVIAWGRADLGNLAVWAPVAIGCGVGAYFSLKTEPAWQIGVIALAISLIMLNRAPRFGRIARAAVFASLGFVAADIRTAQVAAPILDRDLGIVAVSGRLISIEEGASSRRLVIALNSIEGISETDLPAKARISWRGKKFNAAPGDFISLRAGLRPPPPPVAPGTFDFARQLFFQRIGAVGFAVTSPRVGETQVKTRSQKLAASIETMRHGLFLRITRAAPGEGGGIVAAIVTGKRGAVSDRAKAALRDTGLAHLLAISGLHMGLATGLIFYFVRLGLALIEWVALRYPIKKWSAAAALLSGFFYLILSGGGWSARRAFIMAAIIFVAIIVDRRALSLRNVAVAAVIILLTAPEAIFHAGFQMSFAAVTALIAGYEWASRHADPYRSFTWPARLKRYAIGLAATDLIAAIATAPYALYHFNRVAIYSLPANVVAMPLMGFWIMPAAVIALLLAPFGLDGWAWRLSAMGMDSVLAIASEVSAWPGAVSNTAQWPLAAMVALTIGGLWLCLSRAPWRLAGLLGIPAAWLLVAQTVSPTLFVADSGLNAGFVLSSSEEGAMAVYSSRRDKFSINVWKEAVGFEPDRDDTVRMRDAIACDGVGCATLIGNGEKIAVSFVSERRALDEDCARADLVVAFFPVSGPDWRACKAVLIDRYSIWNHGAHAVWIDENGKIRIKTVAETRGIRPWTSN